MRDLRLDAVRIYLGTLERLDLATLFNSRVSFDGSDLVVDQARFHLDDFDEVVLVGLGKASVTLGATISYLLGDRITRGVLVSDRLPRTPLAASIDVLVGAHPIPDANSLEAGRRLLDEIAGCSAQALLIFLVSGGGSSLAEVPISDSISIAELQALNKLLVQCGAGIHDINIVRKFFSRIKGGKAGFLARDVSTLAFFVSDVNEGDLRTIASNPLLPEELSQDDLEEVISRLGLVDKLPASFSRLIESGDAGVPSGWKFSKGVSPILLADNSSALRTAAEIGSNRGYLIQTAKDLVECQYREIVDTMLRRLAEFKSAHSDAPVCILSGGEAACEVRRPGLGGRNQEFVLYSAALLAQQRRSFVCLCAGTDGVDGNSIAAGAVADGETDAAAIQRACNPSTYLSNNDSSKFFSEAGGLIVTGPTGNNVRDVRLMLAE